MEGGRVEERNLSRASLAALFLVHITQAMQTTLPYAISVYMIRDFFNGASESTIGRFTGLLVRLRRGN